MTAYACALLLVATIGAEPLHGTVEGAPKSNILKIRSGDESALYVLYGVQAPADHYGADALAMDCIALEVQDAEVDFEVIRESGRLRHILVTTPNGEDLTTKLIENGVMAFAGYGLECDARYRELEAQSKDNQLGLWAPPDQREWSNLQITEDGRTVSYVDQDGSVVIKSQGNAVPDATVRRRAAQESEVRMQERREAAALRRLLEAEAAKEKAEAERQAFYQNVMIYETYRANRAAEERRRYETYKILNGLDDDSLRRRSTNALETIADSLKD